MTNALIISGVSSNSGKTLLTTALLYHFRKSVRAFKIGPDYIDPQFHEAICNTPSINLDGYLMNKKQLSWVFQNYSDKEISICEGVMGFYDGMDKNASAYDVAKALKIPTVLILDGSGTYITISAIIKGMKTFKRDNQIKAVVINKLSSAMHYALIKKEIEKNFKDITVLGWIEKDLDVLSSRYLGLDIEKIDNIYLEKISKNIIKNIDIETLLDISKIYYEKNANTNYPFDKISKIDKKITILRDKNFSFIYHDNIKFLEELFERVAFVNPSLNELISEDSDIVYIPGGYVESEESYERVKNSNNFKNSLIKHSKSKAIYAECAGLLYLSKCVDEKVMSEILDIEFTLTNKRVRLGYYENEDKVKGHAFHYSAPKSTEKATQKLLKNGKGEFGIWQRNNIYATYLHIMFRTNLKNVKKYFGV